MHTLLLAAALAATGTQAPEDEPTYSVVARIDGIWGDSWINAIADGLRSLEGVTVATRHDDRKNLFKLTVPWKKTLTPLQIMKAVPEGYSYKESTVEITGTVTKDGDGYFLTPNGWKDTIALKASDDVKNAVGKVRVVTGKWTQEDEKKKSVIDVKSIKEPPK